MSQTSEQMLQQAEEYFEKKSYKEIINLLTDNLLKQYSSGVLYAWRARAHQRLAEFETALVYLDKSMEIDSSVPITYIVRGNVWANRKEYDKAIEDYNTAIALDKNYAMAFNNRGLVWYNKKENDEAIEDYNTAIALDKNYTDAYNNRGNVWYNKKEYNKAIEDYNTTIALDKNNATAYNNRGLVWANKKEYDKAIDDYNIAIALDKNNATAYYNRGNAWSDKKEHNKAIKDYNTAIVLDKNNTMAYNNRGNARSEKREYNKAMDDYNTAITLDKNNATAYYNRGNAWSYKKEYDKAIEDFKNYIELTKDSTDYLTKVAQSRIEELEKEKLNKWYGQITEIVQKIRDLLLFKEKCITHYTSLSATKFMLLQSSKFRISEGAFLNDTSEGRALVSFLDFNTISAKLDKTLAEPFTEKPFIGSFVAETKHDDLTLWRMYGKENQIEAKGCALTLDKDGFITAIQQQITGDSNLGKSISEDFQFYSVAYINKDQTAIFNIPGNESKEEELNILMRELKESVQKLDADQKVSIAEQLNSITYLFKSSDYQYEQEVRLIVQGAGFNKTIDVTATPPRVYVELTEITPSVTKITLGPKVDRADEWASAFNYHIRQAHNFKPEIIISHLPFK